MTKKMLIVEDDESIIKLLSEVFCELGEYQIHYARDGVEAGRMIREDIPDIIILDILIPEVTGFEICKSVKSEPATSHTKVIMLSGMAQDSDKQKAREAGADTFITKPFGVIELVERVEKLLKSN